MIPLDTTKKLKAKLFIYKQYKIFIELNNFTVAFKENLG